MTSSIRGTTGGGKPSGRVSIILGMGVVYFFMALLAVTTLFPFFYMVTTSFMGRFEVFHFPPKLIPNKLLWGNYPGALTAMPFARFFLNSGLQVVVVITVRIFIVSMAGYAFARLRFPGRDVVFMFFIATMMIPYSVTLVPTFLILRSLGWIDTYLALTIPLFNYIWGIFLMRQYLIALPSSLEDAGKIDGASEFQIYFKIFMPLSKPVLIVITLFTFTGLWQDVLYPLIVTRSMVMRTVSVGVGLFSYQYGTHFPYQMAAATVVSLPILLLFFFTQRYFMEGINLTAGQV